MVEYNRRSNRHIKRRSLICVLRDVHKLVTDVFLVLIEPSTLVAQHEESITCEWMLMNRSGFGHDLHPTNLDVLLGAEASDLFQGGEHPHIHLVSSALTPKRRDLASFCALDKENLTEVERRS